jgi:hypothetical protein
MKNLVRALVFLMLAAAVVQGGVKAEAQTTAQKRVVTVDESTGELVDVTQAQEAAHPAASGTPGIIILNNQKSTQGSGQVAGQVSGQKTAQSAIQDQPTNVVEDTPLSTSAADRRRRERQGLEMQTEQKIVEKLEDARIEDEKARSERLFNKGFSSRDQKQREEVPVATPAPQIQVIQAPAPVVEKEQEPRVNVKEEIRAAFDEMNKKQAPETQYYIQGLTGIGQYPDAKNVTGNMALGFGVGMVTQDRIVAEGTFQYSQYDVKQVGGYASYPAGYGVDYGSSIPFTKATQYNFQAAMKYQILGGRVRPVVGAIAGYTYRSYEGNNGYSYYGGGYSGGYGSTTSASTNAFDLGALVGLDVQVTTTFSIGADFRYMKNVAYKGNGDYSNAYALQAPFKRLEEINYYLGSVVGKFTF